MYTDARFGICTLKLPASLPLSLGNITRFDGHAVANAHSINGNFRALTTAVLTLTLRASTIIVLTLRALRHHLSLLMWTIAHQCIKSQHKIV